MLETIPKELMLQRHEPPDFRRRGGLATAVLANPQRAVGEDFDDSGTGCQTRYARLGVPAPSSRDGSPV
jgi:hypothetical protein